MKQHERRIYDSLNRIIIILFVLIAGAPFTAGGSPGRIEWQLSDTRLVSRGTVAVTAEGSIRTGIRIEGKATAMDQVVPSEALFTATLTAFSPNVEMPGQTKGFWYLSGNWTITAADAASAARTPRGNPALLAGVIKAALPFDPVVGTGFMEAEVRLQQRGMSPRAWRMARGTFSGTSHMEGSLTITAVPSILTYGRNSRE